MLKLHIQQSKLGRAGRRSAAALLQLLYPAKCVFCGKLLENSEALVCPDCAANTPTPEKGSKRCRFCEGEISAFAYVDQWRESILRYKFGRRPHYARAYGAMMADRLREHPEWACDLVSWVPLSRRRLRRRGYDQARLLAEEIAKTFGIQARKTLCRVYDSRRTQSSINNDAARRANILGAYRAVQPDCFRGKRVLLTDDVLTTGATMNEAAKTLLLAGAAEVYCITAAQTPRSKKAQAAKSSL